MTSEILDNPIDRRSEKRKYPPLRPLTPHEQKLVEDNIGLAYYFANRLSWAIVRGRFIVQNATIFKEQICDDILGTAFVGMCIAAQRYDPERKHTDSEENVKFGTVASLWIRAGLSRCDKDYELKQSKWVDNRVRKTRMTLFNQLEQRSRTEGNVDDCDDDQVIDREHRVEIEDEEDEHWRYLMTLLDLLLNETEIDVLLRRAVQDETLDVIAKHYGCTKQNIQQYEARAKKKLRESKPFVDALTAQVRRREEMRRHEGVNIFWPVA